MRPIAANGKLGDVSGERVRWCGGQLCGLLGSVVVGLCVVCGDLVVLVGRELLIGDMLCAWELHVGRVSCPSGSHSVLSRTSDASDCTLLRQLQVLDSCSLLPIMPTISGLNALPIRLFRAHYEQN